MGLRRSIVQLVAVAVFATIGVVLAGGGPAAACSCVKGSTSKHLADAAAVFTGDVSAVVPVRTATGAASCGSEFSKGTRYLVFARRENDNWTTGLCSGTRRVVDGVLPAEIGAGSPPTQSSNCEPIDIATRLDDVTAAFTGEVTAVDDRPSDPPTEAAEFEVERVYKGDVGRSATVRSSAPGTEYATEFVVGARYLVFAYDAESGGRSAAMIGGPGPGLVTWTCAGTAPLVGAAPAELGLGSTPSTTEVPTLDEAATASADEDGPDPILPVWPTIAIGVLVALSAGWGVRRWERRRST